jgi:hypothetical protein
MSKRCASGSRGKVKGRKAKGIIIFITFVLFPERGRGFNHMFHCESLASRGDSKCISMTWGKLSNAIIPLMTQIKVPFG